ncbi:holo-ACP synthase [Agrilactobacillus fermenti]|uniref:holo-ACP synthase n=1 Tax=Agrilactobacillus fermenti TaxID=2586909 RepID=UPI001E472577|nr:holo-ACP synthase [Agrilactobacillus fermenti]MCD2255959.1 holo-ACP synthase [Agrilactobacillus fermenti]
MIYGIGIDLAEIERIKMAQEKNSQFAAKILTDDELHVFQSFPEDSHRRYEFLAGRFSVKEAYSKAFGSGIGKVSLHDVEVLNDPDTGRPMITHHPYQGRAFVSISHTSTLVMTEVILETPQEVNE